MELKGDQCLPGLSNRKGSESGVMKFLGDTKKRRLTP